MNILSLDAVSVAVFWQFVFAFGFCDRLPHWFESVTLGCVVWLIYVADRLLDGARLDLSRPHLVRHRLHLRYAGVFIAAWWMILCVAITLVVVWLDAATIRAGLIVATLVLGYGAGVHFVPKRSRELRWFGKEFQVGVVFALGVSLLAWQRHPSWALAFSTAATAGLFTANCLLVAGRESTADQQFCESVSAWNRRFGGVLMVTFSISAFGLITSTIPRVVAVCLMGGGVLLVGVARFGNQKTLAEVMPWPSAPGTRRPLFHPIAPFADAALMALPLACWGVAVWSSR